MRFTSYIVKRITVSIVTIFAIITFNFFLFRILPGDPIRLLFRNPNLTQEQLNALYREFGLDKPFYEQFLIYVVNSIKGEFGISFFYRKPVIDILIPRLLNSIVLILPATVVAILLGILSGTLAAWKRGDKTDVTILGVGMGLYSIPTFWLGGMFILLSIYYLHLPIGGMVTYGGYHPDIFSYLSDILDHFILPFITLTLVLYGQFTIIMRNSLIDVLTEDYIETARAKGADTIRILKKHAIPNAMLPMISIIAINLGLVVGGAVLTETVFSWPGVGRLIYDAILRRDYPVLQGAFYIIAISVVLANLIADILYAYLDPRVRY